MITHASLVSAIAGCNQYLESFNETLREDDAYLSFLPLAHVFDRLAEEFMLLKGGSIGYWQVRQGNPRQQLCSQHTVLSQDCTHPGVERALGLQHCQGSCVTASTPDKLLNTLMLVLLCRATSPRCWTTSWHCAQPCSAASHACLTGFTPEFMIK